MKTPKSEYLHHRLADVIMGTEGTPTQGHVETPQEIAGLMIIDYENPLLSLNKAGEKRAGYFLGVSVALGGGTLGSHDVSPGLNWQKFPC